MADPITFRAVVISSLLLVAAGCADVPREAGFADVKQNVSERTGLEVRWNQGTEADKAVEARVAEMLRSELSAEQAVQIALLNNRHLQATYEDLMIAQADLVAAGLLRNPVFDGNIRFSTTGGGTAVELALVQDFIDLLYIPLRQRIAGSEFAAAKLRVTGAVLDLAGETRTAFFSMQASQQMLELRRQVLAATDASYDIAKRLRAAGNTRELDLFTEQALFERSKLDVRAAEAQTVRHRERLNRMMGLWGTPAAEWKVAGRLPDLPDAPADVGLADGLESRAVERSLDLQLRRQKIEAASQTLGLAAPYGLLSEVSLGVIADRDNDGSWGVGPAFSLPIPLFDQGQPAVAKAQAELRRAHQRYAAIAVDVRSRTREACEAVIAAHEQADYHRKVILPLRQKIVDQTQLQYNAMQASPLQLVDARQQQIDAGAGYVRAVRDYWLARAELDQLLLGRMPAADDTNANDNEGSAAPAGGRGGH
ncbi:TolC family protein [Humisphaera borealis]|uniref:TolC family protein n=1 Tax=Humisphaera borealis TaxID=2807512 RepID=A0A7M2X2Y6_9BACT|nr:TolC family protein [Humisphaera borealis]QOV91792.1 TolC family protein [Humisphaera borealis]